MIGYGANTQQRQQPPDHPRQSPGTRDACPAPRSRAGSAGEAPGPRGSLPLGLLPFRSFALQSGRGVPSSSYPASSRRLAPNRPLRFPPLAPAAASTAIQRVHETSRLTRTRTRTPAHTAGGGGGRRARRGAHWHHNQESRAMAAAAAAASTAAAAAAAVRRGIRRKVATYNVQGMRW